MSVNPASVTLLRAVHAWRLAMVMFCLLLIAGGIIWKMTYLYTEKQEFLQKQGDARAMRSVVLPARRGVITDRYGEPLAVSAPVVSIWVDPAVISLSDPKLASLADLLGLRLRDLKKDLNADQGRRFMYLRRHLQPSVARKIEALKIGGLHTQEEYRRFYPASEVTAHLLGFTNLDDTGIEGLELMWDSHLRAESGSQMVLRDNLGRIVKNIRLEKAPVPGKSLNLTIDLRLQYLAYRELKAAVAAHGADSGMLVMLDAKTGEVLAMVNQPSYNPNDGAQRAGTATRNRAVTDAFEPGSTVKPLTVAAALSSGVFTDRSIIDTTPGTLSIGKYTISDHRDYGQLSVAGVITKSSNVGVSKISLAMEASALSRFYENVGFGRTTSIGVPGEASGRVPWYASYQKVQRATMSYGYGLAVTPLQLAQAYLPFANKGVLPPVSLVKGAIVETPRRIMPESVAQNVLNMLETVVSDEGTARRAAVPGYRVGGKTGTVHRVGSEGYLEDSYRSLFVGVAPLSDPRVVMSVIIDNPKGQEYFGGLVAAPVFAKTMEGALRMLNVAPDAIAFTQQRAQ